jgi:hypothetical protein
MATNFAPSVGRVHIDPAAYPSGTSDDANYQRPKLEDIADALVNMGEGWTRVHTGGYSNYMCYTMLERISGSDVAQIVLVYSRSSTGFNNNNRFSQVDTSYRFHVCYKPSTIASVLSNDGSKTPWHSDFCSSGNSFRFAPVQYDYTFHENDFHFVWLADGERVVLVIEKPLHYPIGVAAFGPDLIDTFYNVGTANWQGSGDITHPQPDTQPEIFYVRCYPSMTPGQDYPTSLQWYKTDGVWNGTYGEGAAVRGEWIQNTTPNEVQPFIREPIIVYKSEYGAVWPDTGGVDGNGLKGSIDMDFLSAVNAGPNSENLGIYQRLSGGDLMHVSDGLCVGWDSTFGPMPT